MVGIIVGILLTVVTGREKIEGKVIPSGRSTGLIVLVMGTDEGLIDRPAPKFSNIFFKLPKLTDPNPDTGSHPGAA